MNGGECGVCGDSLSEAEPRDHEAGGRFATGTIVREYTQGQVGNFNVITTSLNDFGKA